MTVMALKDDMIRYLGTLAEPGAPGRYRYSIACSQPTLYASSYAARMLSLLEALDSVSAGDREAWIDYFNAHQQADGLYGDPVIAGQGWYRDDPLWCGRTHLTGHVLGGLTALGGIAPRPFTFLEPYREPDRLVQWLASRDWGARVAWTGNEICNIGRLLQYARDFHGDDVAGRAVDTMHEWLAGHRFNPEIGVWGQGDASDPIWLSHAVQGAYHWWILFFYDAFPVPEPERAIDTLLRTQNPRGGFGWGIHNPAVPYQSSACEDIDSIHPLAQLSVLTTYRHSEVEAALTRAADWVLANRLPDGGFVFLLDRDYAYGHPQLSSPAGVSGLFPTWFRLLSLALIGKALPHHPLGRLPWHFDRCPGPQIWQA